jgi:hypothetical protein
MKIEPKLPPHSKVGNSALKILLLLVLRSWLRAFSVFEDHLIFMNIPAKTERMDLTPTSQRKLCLIVLATPSHS